MSSTCRESSILNASLSITALTSIARSLGIPLIAVTDASPLSSEEQRLRAWQERGCAADMKYMMRDPSLFVSPARLLPGARTIITFGFPYDRRPAADRKDGFGRVARYAWGRDYHAVAKNLLSRFVNESSESCGQRIEARIFSDAVPLLERAIASRAGLGFAGKNTCLISRDFGSRLFLGEVLWNIEVNLEGEKKEPAGACAAACSRCVSSCPTGALEREYTINAGRCISWLTVEKRGIIPDDLCPLIGDRIFGCDACQDVCPLNSHSETQKPAIDDFAFESGAGQFLDLEMVLGIRSESAFNARFSGTPIFRAKREGLLRNAAIVAANTSAESVLDSLIHAFENDPSEIVRVHALRAIASLRNAAGVPRPESFARLLEKAMRDPAEEVRREALLRG